MNEEICQCEHSREMHDSRFSIFKDGEGPRKGERDGECKVNDCTCRKHVAVEK